MKWLILVIVALSAPAHAEDEGPAPVMAPPPPSTEPADLAMKRYFRGEITGGLTLIGMGAVGLGVGTTLLVTADGRDGRRGAAYPLLGIGALHVIAGIFVDVASIKRVRKFGPAIASDPEGFIRREEKRMRGVSTQFLVLKIVEGVGIAGSIGLAAYAHETERPLLTGFGIALASEFAATLIFDIVAARRASRYRTALGTIAF